METKKLISALLCIGILTGTVTACKSDEKPHDGTSAPTDSQTSAVTDPAEERETDSETDPVISPETEPRPETEPETEAETEPPFELETEGEEPPEEIVYPYDNTHAYIFAYSDKKSSYSTADLSANTELNSLHAQPTAGDPMLTFSFTEEEQFSADEYPYMAYRYKVTSTIQTGVIFVASSDHPDMSDSGLTWIQLNNQGEWTNFIVNMKENNAFWSGTITNLRIDPINGLDLDAHIYLDRVGFFKTEADAQAFLEAAEDIDDRSYHISDSCFDALVPAGSISNESVSADFAIENVSLALPRNGIAPLVGIRNGNTVTPIPVSYVNGAGFINYMAQVKGEYVIYYPEKNPVTDADFVKVRGILNDAALSAEAVTLETVWTAFRNTLTDRVDQPISDWAASLGLDTSDSQKIATATDISKVIHAYLKKLDVEVYTDPDYYPAPNAIKAIKVATGSGIITDITASSLSGEELAGVMTRLVKAMLGQPVLPSNIKEDTIKIGGWSGNAFRNFADEDFKLAADCGMNLMVSRGDMDSILDRSQILNSGRKYGIRTLFNDYSPWDYDVNQPAALPSSAYRYYDFDSYMGNHVFDEPGSDFFDEMAHLANRYHDALPGKVCYYNLLPMYANAAQLMYGAGAANIEYYDSDPDLYQKYVEAYAQTVPGDYMCVDIYPLGHDQRDKRTVTFNDYMKNMDIFATACRQYDKDFWLYIQSYNDNDSGTARNDYADYIFQMYVGLSFGVNTFIYFTYGSYNVDDALIDAAGQPTAQYYDAQKANREIMALSDDYMQYKNLGAFNLNCSKGIYKYARFDNQYTEFDVLKEVNSDNGLLFGCFEKEEGEGYAFSVVNLIDGVDRDRSKPATLTFTLEGKHTVSAWIKGEKVALTPVDGVYTLNLDVAEGAFVTID